MNIFFSSRLELSLKKYGVILRLDLNDWGVQFRNSKTSAVKSIIFGPFHLNYINYEKMNESLQEMIAAFEASEPDVEQYMMSELEDINIPKTLN